ncbi:MAG: eCIS core domain-containing protein [Planctomycetota bacterium]
MLDDLKERKKTSVSELEQKQNRKQSGFLARSAVRDRSIPKPAHDDNPLLTQRQALGNQAMQRFAQSCPLRLPSASICPFGGVCHTCPARVQTKLTINESGDKYEQEADRVADEVMRMPDPIDAERAPLSRISTIPYVQRQCPECEEELQRQPEEEEEEEELLQAKKISDHTPEVNSSFEVNIKAVRSSGQTLPDSVRAYFEPRFGYDFSRVRIHTDTRAVELAEMMNARAFTVGTDIVFRSGQYEPYTTEGKKLLSHELVHVIQQRREGSSVEKQNRALDAKRSYTKSKELTPPKFLIQRAAPVAAAAGGLTIGAALVRCAIGAVLSVIFDYGLQRLTAWWRGREYRHNWCRTILSAVIGCFGGIAVGAVLAYMARIGVRFSSGPILGRILQWLVAQLSIFFPRSAVSVLLKLGCVNEEQAEAITR